MVGFKNKNIRWLAALFSFVRAEALHITNVDPQQTAPGFTVTITGTGFAPTDNTFNLTFPDGTVAIYHGISSEDNGTIIQGVVPQIIIGGRYSFFISNGNGISNTVTLDIDIIASAANFIVNNIEVGFSEGEGPSGSNPVTVTNNEDGTTTVTASLGELGTVSVTVSLGGNPISMEMTNSEGLTTTIGNMTTALDGTITGTISQMDPSGQVSQGLVTVEPNGVISFSENENDSGSDTDPDPDSESSGLNDSDEGGLDAGGGAGLGGGPGGPADAPSPSDTEGEGPGEGVDAGVGAGLGETGVGESDGGSAPDGSGPDGAADF